MVVRCIILPVSHFTEKPFENWSAADAASAWDLRCDVREHLVGHLREHHPEAVPRFWAESPEALTRA